MSEENQETEEIAAEEISVAVVVGEEFEMSDRLGSALEELAAALADAEEDEVSGFQFAPAMSFDSGMAFSNDPQGLKVNIGCVVKVTGCTRCGERSGLMGTPSTFSTGI